MHEVDRKRDRRLVRVEICRVRFRYLDPKGRARSSASANRIISAETSMPVTSRAPASFSLRV